MRAQIILRSKTPELVKQEFYGLLMAHFAVRGSMHEAALQADEDPDHLFFLLSVRLVQRRMARFAAIPPLGREKPFIRRSLENSFRNGVYRAAIGSAHAA